MKVEIEFVQWLSGHDRATVKQMYTDWHNGEYPVQPWGKSFNNTLASNEMYNMLGIWDVNKPGKPDEPCKCAMPETGTAGNFCNKCHKFINKPHF